MAEIIKNRGNFTILTYEMETRNGIVKLKELKESTEIVSSIDDVCLYGKVTILDRGDVITRYQVTGGETITLVYQVSDDTPIKHKFIVQRISDESKDSNEAAKRYSLEFISEDHPKFMEQYAISMKGLTTSCTSDFFYNKIQSAKKLELGSPSKWNMHFVTQNWTGYNVVDFLMTRAMNGAGNSGYHFYETWEKFHFKNMVEEFNKAPVTKYIKKEETIPFDLTYKVYDEYNFVQLGHYDAMLNAGYSNTASFFDPFHKKYTPKKDETHPFDRQTINKKTTTTSSKHLRYNYVKPHPNMPDPHIIDMVQKRVIENGTLDDVVITIRVPGQSKVIPGVPIELTTKEVERANMFGVRDNLSPLIGKYLVTSVTDILADEYHQLLTLKRFKKS